MLRAKGWFRVTSWKNDVSLLKPYYIIYYSSHLFLVLVNLLTFSEIFDSLNCLLTYQMKLKCGPYFNCVIPWLVVFRWIDSNWYIVAFETLNWKQGKGRTSSKVAPRVTFLLMTVRRKILPWTNKSIIYCLTFWYFGSNRQRCTFSLFFFLLFWKFISKKNHRRLR